MSPQRGRNLLFLRASLQARRRVQAHDADNYQSNRHHFQGGGTFFKKVHANESRGYRAHARPYSVGDAQV